MHCSRIRLSCSGALFTPRPGYQGIWQPQLCLKVYDSRSDVEVTERHPIIYPIWCSFVKRQCLHFWTVTSYGHNAEWRTFRQSVVQSLSFRRIIVNDNDKSQGEDKFASNQGDLSGKYFIYSSNGFFSNLIDWIRVSGVTHTSSFAEKTVNSQRTKRCLVSIQE